MEQSDEGCNELGRRLVDMKDIFPMHPPADGMRKGFPIDIISSGINVGKTKLEELKEKCDDAA